MSSVLSKIRCPVESSARSTGIHRSSAFSIREPSYQSLVLHSYSTEERGGNGSVRGMGIIRMCEGDDCHRMDERSHKGCSTMDEKRRSMIEQ